MKIGFKRLLSALLAFLMAVTSFTFIASASGYADVSTVTEAAISEIKVKEPLDYEVGDDIVFKFQIKSGDTVLTAPYLYYNAQMDDGRVLTGYAEPADDATYTVTLEKGLLKPGFVFMKVNACNSDKVKYSTSTLPKIATYSCGAGANIGDIQAVYGKPSSHDTFGDFDAFWEKTLAPMNEEGGEATVKYIYYAGTVEKDGTVFDCYELEINCPMDEHYDKYGNNWGGTNHVFAYLTIPRVSAGTKLGIELGFKGYDWISASGSHTSIAPQTNICYADKIYLSVSPHSVPAPHNVADADANSEWVSDGAYIGEYYNGAEGGYLYDTYGYSKDHGMNKTENADPNTTYFKYMIMRNVQAARFMMRYFNETGVSENVNGIDTSVFAGLWDGVSLKTSGGSQGGFQAISVAGLVPEVNEVKVSVPWFGDHGVATEDSDRYVPAMYTAYGVGLHYMDTANHASNISTDCNVTIDAGLVDNLVPPSTVMSIYEKLNCAATLTFHQNKAHVIGGAAAPYTQTISKNAFSRVEERAINFVNSTDSTLAESFASAWRAVTGETVKADAAASVDIYVVDKNTDIDFELVISQSTAEAVGVILTGDGLININEKLSEIYALHNEMLSKLWVIGNDGTVSGEDAAITLAACMNGGNKSTSGGAIKLYTADGEVGQSFILGSNVPYAVIPSPLWISGQGIITETENITLSGGFMSSGVEDGSVTFTSPAHSVTYNMVGVGDSVGYGNIEGVGLWTVEADGTLTIKGTGAIPNYESYASTPWAELDVTSVKINEGITSIGAYAFDAASALTVSLPVSVTEIESSSFNSDASIISYDNAYAKTFANENGLSFTNQGGFGSAGTDLTWSYDLSGTLTVSGTGTTLYSGCTGYGKEADSSWYCYYSEITKVIICDSVTAISKGAFNAMKALKSVEITENLTNIGSSAFENCENLASIYVKGNEALSGTYDLTYVTSMTGGYQFDGAGKNVLSDLILSEKLTGTLGDKFIGYNTKMTSLKIPEGVAALTNRAIFRCTALKELTVLGSSTSIPSDFLKLSDEAGKTVLSTIYGREGSSAQTYAESNSIEFSVIQEVIATGKAGADLYWRITEEEDGSRTMTIYGTGTYIQPYDAVNDVYGFSGTGLNAWTAKAHEVFDFYKYASDPVNKLTTIVIDATYEKIQGYTFASFDYVTTLVLSDTITKLGAPYTSTSCFNDMGSLSTVYTKGQKCEEGTANLSAITDIPSLAFAGNKFKKIIFAENVYIRDKAFMYSSALEKLELPEGVKLDGTAIFCSNTSASKNKLSSISFPESRANIPYNIFNMTDNGTSFTANKYVTTLIVKNSSAVFGGATDAAPYTAFLNNFTGLTTVYGHTGSTAEAMVTWANENTDRTLTFISLDEAEEDVGMPIGDELWYKLIENGDGETYTMEIYGTGTTAYAADADGNKVTMDYNVTGETRSFYEYASKITRIKIATSSITKYNGYMFKGLAVDTLELHPDIDTIAGSNAFKGLTTLATVYVTGNEPVTGVADLSNIKTFGAFNFINHKFKKIILSEELTTIPTWCFGDEYKVSVLEEIVIPASVNSISANAFTNAVKLVYAKFDGDSFTYDASSFTGMAARATVIAAAGSSGAQIAEELGAQYIDSAEIPELYSYSYKGNSVVIIGKNASDNYTAFATGSATAFDMGYDFYGNAVANTSRPWSDIKDNLRTVKFINQKLVSIDATFAAHTSLATVECPASLTTLGNCAFNGSRVKTLYITGSEPETGVVDLRNISVIGDLALANVMATSILFSDNLSGTWGDYLFFQCSNLTYVRIPKGITELKAVPFANNINALTTVLIENPTLKINDDGYDPFGGAANLATVIGYKNSSAETYANEKGLEFIPLDSENVLTFEGFQIREKDYNGLRSIFTVNIKEIGKRNDQGIKVLEIGSLLASTDKLTENGAELTVSKNSDGKYISHDYAIVVPVYQNGEQVGKVMNLSTESVQYACTITNFSASNYNKNATFRGYIVFADKEGNEYIAYADLADTSGSYADENGVSYNITSLESVCNGMIESGRDISAYISWTDIEGFKKKLVSVS